MVNFIIANNHLLFQQGLKDICSSLGNVTFWSSNNLTEINARLSQSPMIDIALVECSALTVNSTRDILQMRKASPLTSLVIILQPETKHVRSELIKAGAHEVMQYTDTHIDVFNRITSLVPTKNKIKLPEYIGVINGITC